MHPRLTNCRTVSNWICFSHKESPQNSFFQNYIAHTIQKYLNQKLIISTRHVIFNHSCPRSQEWYFFDLGQLQNKPNIIQKLNLTPTGQRPDGTYTFEENKQAAQRGGQIAHNARKELEQETGKTIVSKDNFLSLTEKKKLSQKKKNAEN